MLHALALTLALAGAACTESRLDHTHPSAIELARAIADAVAAKDVARLHSLALSEEEFKQVVWPSLPAARPERSLPFSYVWGDLRQKSEGTLHGTVAAHGGRRYHVQDVKFAGSPRAYGPYRVHSDATFVVRENNAFTDLRLCGSFIEMGGRWKAFSYAIDR